MSLGAALTGSAMAQAPTRSPRALVIDARGFAGRTPLAHDRPVTRRELRRAFPEYFITRQERDAEAGGTYELYCFRHWAQVAGRPPGDCVLELVLEGDRPRRLLVFDARASTPDGLTIGAPLRDHEAALRECHTDNALETAVVCELPSVPEAYVFFSLDPAEHHEPPLPEQLDSARVERFELHFASPGE